MKRKCINAKHNAGLTAGKLYKVLSQTRNTYEIINDRGYKSSIKKTNFVTPSFMDRLKDLFKGE